MEFRQSEAVNRTDKIVTKPKRKRGSGNRAKAKDGCTPKLVAELPRVWER